jgi:pyridoxine/pyridoxamine 5'-phosphate oxidase
MKKQAFDIIDKSKVIFLATVDEDGSPRSTIVLGGVSETGVLTWRSSPDAVHSQNIIRDGKVGISAYYEDSEINDFRAIYVSTVARDIGNEKFNNEKQHTTHEYVAQLGEYDEAQSKPNRLYFKESE